MSNYQHEYESEDDRACRLIFQQRCLQHSIRQETIALDAPQDEFVLDETSYQNEQAPHIEPRELVPLDGVTYPDSWYPYQDWNPYDLPSSEVTTSESYFATEEQMEQYILAWEAYFDQTQNPPDSTYIDRVDSEVYDEKNLYRYDGNMFIDEDPIVTSPLVAVPEIIPPVISAPAIQSVATSWKDTLLTITRRRSCIALDRWCNNLSPASDWKFNQRIAYIPRKDEDWRDLQHQMNGVPIEVMDGKWVNGQCHWMRASASNEALRSGRWSCR